ncbi:response regulator [Sediminibacillus massiliensis]|uniref:response regulator n=1 Tax=Sediminibacillus massiliensis TaxID=1926277 RepID=UPI000988404A|nr:response regulator [Sediminibacillus massiliensis]
MAKVLIVDDAVFSRKTLIAMLKKGNHEVIGEADDGRQAIEKYRELSPDMVILDITMPVLNGMAALEEIMKTDNNARVIMCSATAQQKLVVKAIELGAKDFIVKPFDETRVLEAVNRVSI